MHPSKAKVAAIITAAGSGSRMGLSAPKQFYELGGIPILIHTLHVFQQVNGIEVELEPEDVMAELWQHERIELWFKYYQACRMGDEEKKA